MIITALIILTGVIGKGVYDNRLTPDELNKINRTDETCHNTGNEY